VGGLAGRFVPEAQSLRARPTRTKLEPHPSLRNAQYGRIVTHTSFLLEVIA
jgi:hypothetical protein